MQRGLECRSIGDSTLLHCLIKRCFVSITEWGSRLVSYMRAFSFGESEIREFVAERCIGSVCLEERGAFTGTTLLFFMGRE